MFRIIFTVLSVLFFATLNTQFAAANGGGGKGGPPPMSAEKRGLVVMARCHTCHAVFNDEKERQAPGLYGIIGRPVASQFNYNYSQDLKNLATVVPVWTKMALEAYLADPILFLQKMLRDDNARGKMGQRLERKADRTALLALFEKIVLFDHGGGGHGGGEHGGGGH